MSTSQPSGRAAAAPTTQHVDRSEDAGPDAGYRGAASGLCACPACGEDRLVAGEHDGQLHFRCEGCATLWHYGVGRLWTVSS